MGNIVYLPLNRTNGRNRIILDEHPTTTPNSFVDPIPATAVPPKLREHAWDLFHTLHGPHTRQWWTIGTFPHHGIPVILTARVNPRMATGQLEYGTTDHPYAPIPTPCTPILD